MRKREDSRIRYEGVKWGGVEDGDFWYAVVRVRFFGVGILI